MSSEDMNRTTRLVVLSFLLLMCLTYLGYLVMESLQQKITTRLEKGWVLPPLELYSQGLPLSSGRRFPLAEVEKELERKNLQNGRDYYLESVESCAELTRLNFSDNAQRCLWLREPALVVTWDADGWIVDIWRGTPWQSANSYSLFPELITQFFEGQPILKENTPLSEFPLQCLQAVTAIEDKDFLLHPGVSATGTLRAVLRNLKAGRFAEGGSTITQQLVKNFFLSSKKTLKRKIEEQFLSLLLEAQISKDQILEMYLNVIYMGQSGPYQVRGLGSAASVNFDKPIGQLSLGECALLAAMINSPGRYSPFEHPEAAKKRRELVLQKMRDAEMISEADQKNANTEALPKVAPAQRRTHAPYFVVAALREFSNWEAKAEEGARLYTSLDPIAQNAVHLAIQKVLPAVEKRIKKPPADPLEVAAVAVDIKTAEVLAMVGGRNFRTTQFNRAIDANRQIGSIVKPFVYWNALRTNSPLTPLEDEPFEWKIGKKVWQPRNYDGKTLGKVPYFYALANSMNIPTARLGQEVGLEAIIDLLKLCGVTTPIQELPSLTLGALELSPFTVAQMYLPIARLGTTERLHLLNRAENLNGEVLFEYQPTPEPLLDPVPTSMLVGMMKQTVEMGTAKALRLWKVNQPLAGKTGTTSDTKDAWFVGFSPRLLMVVWVGYDKNAPMGLSGSSAALPIWSSAFSAMKDQFPETDFQWPEGVELRTLNGTEILRDYENLTDLPETIQLVLPDWAS
ncbi:MAG: transglycosylase domain-containing protein [Bdellovibrionales bacterium]